MRKFRILLLLIVVLLVVILPIYFLSTGSEAPQLQTAKAVRQEIKMVVSTNGIIEPLDRSEVYAPIDGRVIQIPLREGSEISQGHVLMQLESEQIRTALADAKAGLLDARRQANAIVNGPPKEEIAALDATIAEAAMELDQVDKDLAVEESLLSKGAVARAAVENLRKQRDQYQLRLDSQKKQKQDVLQRYSSEEKQWEQDKVGELTKQVQNLEQQLRMESVMAPKGGLIYSLEVKPGAYVTKGQLLAQINQPGIVKLRAYVDEPDLGRIAKGQSVSIEWDGMADTQWTGIVERPAEQVVALNNRTVGYVLCSINGEPKELIPNLNVKVEITTARKPNVLTVPRSAVFNQDGKQVVLVVNGEKTAIKPVALGMITAEDIEILQGIREGDLIVLNPMEGK
jgi:HlyD family secretion protein